MDAVLKVGGSLAEKPATLKKLCKKLSKIGENHSITVVPGGGRFADTIREIDQQHSLPADAAHKMAILGMDQFGLLLVQIIPNSCVTYSLKDSRGLSKRKTVPIFLPSRLMFKERPLEASWDVTSDSITAYIASRLKANRAILVTNVDGIFESDPRRHSDAKLIQRLSAQELLEFTHRTSVDKFLPKLLLKTHVDCYVVNGAYPERIADILLGKSTICTLVKA